MGLEESQLEVAACGDRGMASCGGLRTENCSELGKLARDGYVQFSYKEKIFVPFGDWGGGGCGRIRVVVV